MKMQFGISEAKTLYPMGGSAVRWSSDPTLCDLLLTGLAFTPW